MVVYTLEQRWEILPILAKKIIFSNEAHFDLGGYVNQRHFGLNIMKTHPETKNVYFHKKNCLFDNY